jgi:D-glycero-D-manno-heptose 1,7-bisphosphate phosphatase
MIEEALREHPLDLQHSWMIGDKQSDMELAYNAGIGNSIYIGDKTPSLASFSFASVADCAHYFQENPGKIEEPK